MHQCHANLSCTTVPPCTKAICHASMLLYEPTPCINALYQYPCINAMHQCLMSMSCINAMRPCHVSIPCISTMHQYHAPTPRINTIHQCHALVPCTNVSINSMHQYHAPTPSICAGHRCPCTSAKYQQYICFSALLLTCHALRYAPELSYCRNLCFTFSSPLKGQCHEMDIYVKVKTLYSVLSV
jgi:hypothetical protein